jgi:hypothetical protein
VLTIKDTLDAVSDHVSLALGTRLSHRELLTTKGEPKADDLGSGPLARPKHFARFSLGMMGAFIAGHRKDYSAPHHNGDMQIMAVVGLAGNLAKQPGRDRKFHSHPIPYILNQSQIPT